MTVAIREVAITGYRSVRAIRFPLRQLNVFVGANGVGKTNLYRGLQLVRAAAAGTLARELAAEGGMESALWAGVRDPRKPARIKLGVEFGTTGPSWDETDDPPRSSLAQGYEIEVGLPMPGSGGRAAVAAFPLEPQIKAETLTSLEGRRPRILLERRGPMTKALDAQGRKQSHADGLMASETALGSLDDPIHFPDVAIARRLMLDWRFYHDFRTDAAAPLRRPCLAVTTPTLSSDGADLAAVFATLVHIREDTTELDAAIDDAFPGAQLVCPVPGRHASFGIIFPDYPKRVFEMAELSDGTLRYLALMGALLSYRLPGFVALNEPETSLHPDLLGPLARLIARAARHAQIWLVTHSEKLAAELARHGGVTPRTIIRRDGGTWIEGLRLAGNFADDES
ncbi:MULTISPECIES: AAA family ATPase [unclassified Chelatococcus]|uniref:AAA family ATPase n=1 Tax=unclassified Chelatococcus TaxID=2638111 RepID=UPI001BCBF822|nr:MULTISPECIES: AAA family ATPase [unclassified Chelatococcus]MBS7697091.1 AAA family ATPase [Chelatococcus sp. YT9]MBX3556081.1 AAA family ATPase [Chelatococcus sp.]